MNKQQTTIFNQLILNVIVPTLIALLVMAAINFRNTSSLINNSNNQKNQIISNEITEVLGFQELAISIIEKNITERLELLSSLLVNEILRDTRNIEKIDLSTIRDQLGMDPETEDLYIIDRDGFIVNTTYKKDLGFNLFSIGEEHKNHLLHVFDTGVFVNTRFAIEASTKRPRKYTYHSTLDREYIVEIGVYSSDTDEVLSTIENIKKDIINDNIGIIDVEIFFMADTIFSLNDHAVVYDNNALIGTFSRRDSSIIFEKEGNQWYHYQYMYVPRANTLLYKDSVIRIVSDRTAEKLLAKKELLKLLILLLITLVVVMVLIYRKTMVITDPIKKLVDNVDRITGGHLSERAEVIGNNEITRLSEKFNMMIDELEKYYNELEQMVKDRTAKIEKQKMEIEAQSDILREQKDKLYQRNTQLNAANYEIEEQKKHIMDSIYYARRIQTAILPSDDYIRRYLKNFFILYKPKDIVSGDFYWFFNTDEHIMISAVDCTGHGVPGAFMSIVGHNQLNHAVNVNKSRSAEAILNDLNRGVTQTLNENSNDSKVMDGMDMALCIFDCESKKVQFSGANNPMIFIRNGELTQFKGDKFPIGAYEGVRPQVFTRIEQDLEKEDMIYIFSDGYPDQFGGPDDKKFTSKRFKELLLEIHKEPVGRQKEILEERLNSWMADTEQLDDILVIGIKI